LSDRTNAVLNELLNLLLKWETGVPKQVVESRLTERFSADVCRDTIRYALDNFLVDLVVDYPLPTWGILEGHHVWHFRRLSPESAKKLQDLDPVDLALVRLLQQQAEPGHIGEMRERDAKAELTRQGFKEDELRALWIDGMADSPWAFEGDEKIKWLRLVPEYEKTEEHKRAEEEWDRIALDREALHTRIADEMDKEEERRQKRSARDREKRLKRQST